MWVQQRQEQQQVVRVDPKLVLASSILQMNTIEMEQAVEQELNDNPALERLEEDPETEAGAAISFNEREPATIAFDDAEAYANKVFNPDDENDWVSCVVAPTTLHDFLREQLLPQLPDHIESIGEYLIECVNAQGYLEMDVEEVALLLNADLAEVEQALQLLQGCDPPGVGARNLQECLLLQIQQSNFMHARTAARMINETFEQFTKREWKRIARALKAPLDVVEQCGQFVVHLTPYPGDSFRPEWEFRSTSAPVSVRPDVIIRRSEQGYEVEIKGIDPNSLGINSRYRDLYLKAKNGKGLPEGEKQHVQQYTDRAVNFINSLKQRRRTVRKIIQHLIDTQQGFISTGSYFFLRPMTRLQLSKEIGLHESTVSRATMHKFVQLPNGEVLPFEVFFKPSLRVKKLIEQILETEDPAKPLSDERIAAILKEQGIEVARRTINKYRGQTRILSSRRR